MNHTTLVFQQGDSKFQNHYSFIMAKEASLCLLFLSFLIIFFSGFSYLEKGDTALSTSAAATFLQKSKIFKSQIQYFVSDHKIWSILSRSEGFEQKELKKEEEEETFPLLRRNLEDMNNSPNTGFPTNPASGTPAAITPPNTPTIITVPSTNPVTVSPTNPAASATPVTVPSTPPVPLAPTNPANSPVPVTNPVTPPITVPGGAQPGTSYPPPSGSVPVTNPQPPPANTNAPASTGQSWCVAKTGVSQTTLQTALDYACGTGTADCSQIQQGGSCYNPNSLQNHASFAFNSYYQKNPAPTSCDFGGVANIVNTNPSSGTCIFPSASGGAGTSGSGNGTTTTPPSGSGFGPQSPPDVDSSHSNGLRPFLSCIVLVIPLVIGRLGMNP